MSLFFRLNTDGVATPVQLENVFAGPQPSACWLIGGGPSLNELPCDAIASSPLPKMALNLSGAKRLRPTFWTSYDPTVRFHRSVYLDPGILKFVHRRRAMDLAPETTFKVCDCPGVLFFDRDAERRFDSLLDPQATGIVDWSDTMVQAIDILYRLGFRRIFLAGCELRVRPASEHLRIAHMAGVEPNPLETLSEFMKRCGERGVSRSQLEQSASLQQYHFDEQKTLAAAIQTDAHYFRIAQCLRLSRSCLVRHGLELISVTPGSRLNDYFASRDVEQVLGEIVATVGDVASEPERGCYTQSLKRWSDALGPMRDVQPPVRTRAGKVLAPGRSVIRVHRPGMASDEAELIVETEGWTSDELPFDPGGTKESSRGSLSAAHPR